MNEGLLIFLKHLFQVIKFPRVQLFLTSFTILYLELSLIRFIPAYVRYLGYFTNFILLGSFLGIGLGCLIAKNRRDILLLFTPLFLILVILIKYFKFEVQISTTQSIFFTSNSESGAIESFLLLPSIFLLVTLLFTTLAQNLGRLLTRFQPLTAYSLDILGSLVGIVVFTVGSFWNLPPVVWFTLISILYIVLIPSRPHLIIGSAVILSVTLALMPTLDSLPTTWSPYQKVSLYSVSNPRQEEGKPDDHWRLYVNNISHQEMTTFENIASFYKYHYQEFLPGSFRRALIVGSGSGQDVDVALKYGVQSIDAVEIDPVIANLGKQFHPDRPYGDKRVHLIINDARSFLESTNTRYDLIIFALPDSTILTTSLSNLRLESYLFTLEAFQQVKSHLTDDGLFVLYNYYRAPWLIDKIANMLEETFDRKPLVASQADNLAVFMIGSRAVQVADNSPFREWKTTERLRSASDDWPFLYLREMSLPRIYLKSLGIILFTAVFLTLLVTQGKIIKHLSGDFFFLGAAFLLIETKSIVNFNLLFGSTWLVNSLVFIGILLSVLAAIWVNYRWKVNRMGVWVVLLLVSLIANYVIPLDRILLANVFERYVVSTIFFFSPIFLANVIFSRLFKQARRVSDNFGVNLLGAFFGGTIEYTSLLWGYHNLILVAIVFYILAYYFIIRRLR